VELRDGEGGDVVGVFAGGGVTCAVFEDGVVRCWGDNAFSQLGEVSNIGDVASPREAYRALGEDGVRIIP
jgi:hypothetical protein